MSKKNRDSSRRIREMQAAQRAAERRNRNLMVGGVVVFAIAIVVAVGIGIQSSRNDTGAGSDTPRNTTETYGIARGDSAAPVTVTMYEDFQCPVCRQYEAWLGATITEDVDAGEIQVIYRPMAFLDDASTTDYSSRALESAGCALDEDGVDTFVALHELLFENQPAEGTDGLSDSEIADLAEQAGADRAELEKCQADNTFAGWVRAATEAASKDNVTSTPTMLVAGQELPLINAQDQPSAIQLFEDAVAAATG